MNDMTQVIVPKSDQINADDLIGGPMTIKVSEVRISPGTEQPVSIVFEGSNKFYRPCKSMSRVLVAIWGPDAKRYVGRSLTLFRDPNVKWGGMAVGGIRISHLSNMDAARTMALTESKANRKPFTVQPLAATAGQGGADAPTIAEARAAIAGAASLPDLEAVWRSPEMRPFREQLKADLDDRKAALSFTPEGPTDDQRGESHTGMAGDLIARIEAADADALKALEADYQSTGRAMFETVDQDRIENAIDQRKAALS